MARKLKDQPNDHIFPSVAAFAEFLDETPRHPKAGTSSTAVRDMDWDLKLGYDNAMDIARGKSQWDEGAHRIADGVAHAATKRAPVESTQLGHAVAGFTPDVPAFLAGIPENMRTIEECEAPAEIVSIGFTGFSCGMKADHMLNRGIALLSLVDALESNGYRCEIMYDDEIKGARVRCVIKSAGDHWDPTTAAYAMAHPGFFRRLRFAFVECFEECLWATRSGYGSCSIRDEYTFRLGYETSGSQWSTLDRALEHVESLAQSKGFEVNLTGEGA